MARYEITDREWELLAPLLPAPAGCGRPRRPAREMLNGMFWVLRSGAPWRDLPERYGPWQTVYHQFSLWRRTGVFDRLLQALQIRLDAAGHIDWDLWCIDGTNVRAARAAAGARKKGRPTTSPPITRWVARAADGGAKSTWSLTVEESPSPRISRPAKSTSRRNAKR